MTLKMPIINNRDSRYFNSFNPHWQDNYEYNMLFIRAQINYINARLMAEGHLFLNDAYAALGLEKSSRGQVMGWINDGETSINPHVSYLDDNEFSIDFPGVEYILDTAFI